MTPSTRDSYDIGTRSMDSAPRLPPTWIPRPSAAASPSRIVALWSATHPVSPSPIRIRRRSNDGVPISLNSPWNAMGSQVWVTWSTRKTRMVSCPISLSASATIASPMPSISWIRLRREESSWMARSRAAPSRTELNRRAFATAIAIWFANVVSSSSSRGVQS